MAEGTPGRRGGRAGRPEYFYRLPLRAQRAYLKSEAVERYQIEPGGRARGLASELTRALEASSLGRVNQLARALADELCARARVREVSVEVRGVRPHNARGELHGIYYEAANVRAPGRIVLWMKTAKRHDVVKPKTFVRTLIHELGHYFDYALLGLDESFHTEGFFKRESALIKALSEPPIEPSAREMPRTP